MEHRSSLAECPFRSHSFCRGARYRAHLACGVQRLPYSRGPRRVVCTPLETHTRTTFYTRCCKSHFPSICSMSINCCINDEQGIDHDYALLVVDTHAYLLMTSALCYT